MAASDPGVSELCLPLLAASPHAHLQTFPFYEDSAALGKAPQLLLESVLTNNSCSSRSVLPGPWGGAAARAFGGHHSTLGRGLRSACWACSPCRYQSVTRKMPGWLWEA